MRRLQVAEIEDLSWCPRAVRDGGTDWLRFMADGTRIFDAVAPKIRAAMDAMRTSQIVDLCAGAGGPWLTLSETLAASGPVTIVLTDLYPNLQAFADLRARSHGRLTFDTRAVDVANVPADLEGVRTMFNAFHHFRPEDARAILADAVRQRRAIAIFETISNRLGALVAMPFLVPAILLLTPFVRPFRWSRLALTYALPLIPLLVVFDGTMSVLRIYLPDDLRALVAQVPGHETFTWDIGTTRVSLPGLSMGLTHLIGVPKA